MTASDTILRARNVSDLQNSQFLSHLDEINSLNESWKDIYSAFIENDDDYYVTEVNLAIGPSVAVAGSPNEYLVPLPIDFLKLRYLDWQIGADWMPVKKFNLSMKNSQPGDPYYRLKGNNLWIVGGSVPATGLTLRLGYYPAPLTITAPQNDLIYGTSYTIAQLGAVLSPGYAPLNQTIIYANANVITSESITLRNVSTPVALFTESGPPSNFVYWKGILYYLRGGSIWFKATQLAAAFTAPTQVGAFATAVCFYITADTIYYATATAIRSCTLTGASDVLVNSTANVTSLVVMGPIVIYRTTASLVAAVSPVVTIYASSIAKIVSDGSGTGLLYLLDNAGNSRRVTLNLLTLAILTDDIVDSSVTDIGEVSYDPGQNPATWIIPSLKFNSSYQQLLGVDGTLNYSFTYPNNLVPEIMAWQSAIDYYTKQGKEPPLLHVHKLGAPTSAANGPASGLWGRFEQMIRRDEFTREKINNAYRDWPRYG